MFRRNFLIAIIGVAISQFAHSEQSNAERPLEVIVQPVNSRALQNNIEALGNIHANETTNLTPRVAKTVTQIHFEDGQAVKKGDLLVEMTNAEETALMNEARLTANEAKKQLERTQALAKTGAVSPALLDQRTREYEAAQAHFLAVQSRLNDLLVVAPFSGSLGIRNISVGSLIIPGQTITTLTDDSKVKLDFTIPAIYLRNIVIGLPVEAKSHDLGDQVFKGKIVSIENQIDEATRSIKVRSLLENSKHELKQGLLMTVTVGADIRKSLVINEAALVPMGSNNFVFVAKANQAGNSWLADKRQVKIGQRYAGVVEIVGGLVEGEKVVTHGLQKIHAGQSLKILAEQANDPNKKTEALSDLLQTKHEGK